MLAMTRKYTSTINSLAYNNITSKSIVMEKQSEVTVTTHPPRGKCHEARAGEDNVK